MNLNPTSSSSFTKFIVNSMDYIPIASTGKSIVKIAQRAISSGSSLEVENVAKTAPHSYRLIRGEKNVWRDILGLVPIIGNICLVIFDAVASCVGVRYAIKGEREKNILRKAAELGNTEAVLNIKKILRKAAEFGNTEAMLDIADICFDEGTLESRKEAVAWICKAISFGRVDKGVLMTSLGYCYKRGIGVDQDYKEAVKYFQEAVKKNNAEAMRQLGYCYYEGLGVSQDKEQAKNLFELSFSENSNSHSVSWALNNMDSQKSDLCDLARCYEDVFEEKGRAISLYDQAAIWGSKEADYALALLYERQLLIPHKIGKSPSLMKEIHSYLKEASFRGHKEATEKLKELFPSGSLEPDEYYEKGPYIN